MGRTPDGRSRADGLYGRAGTVICCVLLLATLDAGCARFDRYGLGTDNDLIDAEARDTIAADTAPTVDTAGLADTMRVDSANDAQPEAETEADAAPPFCEINANLIACYRFELTEHAMQPWDDSAYAHHGTSMKVTPVAGVSGQAIQLAADSTVRVPSALTLVVSSQITIEGWIKPKTLPPTGRAGLVDNNGAYGLFIAPGAVLRATSPAQLDSAAAVLTVGVWQHVAYTYDGSKQALYVNGVQVISRPLAGGTLGLGDFEGLALGMNSPSGDVFDGAMDSVRIWKIARTAKQICEAAGKSPC